MRPARIAFVSDAVFPFNKGGKEKRLHEIATQLAHAGHQVDVYTMKWWIGRGRTHVVDGVRLRAICEYRPLYSGARRSMPQAIIFGLATLRLLFRRFDVVDVDHMPFFPLFTARLVCWVRRRRLVATWHEVWGPAYWREYLGGPGIAAAVVERLAARMPDEIVAVSDQTAGRVRDQLKTPRPVHAIPLGVPLESIDAAPATSARTDVIYAGRLLENKNVDILLRAVEVCARAGRLVTCTVIGEGPEREALEKLAVELGVSDRITFSDFVPYPQLYGRMKSAGMLAQLSTREGFGLVVLEANAGDIPVIAVRHPDNAAQNLIVPGRNGVVVDLDPGQVAGAIGELLDNRASFDPRSYVDGLRPAVTWEAVATRVEAVLLNRSSQPAGRHLGGRRSFVRRRRRVGD